MRRRLLVLVLALALTVGVSVAQVVLPLLPPVTPPTIVWDVMIIAVGGSLGWAYQEEISEALVWVGRTVTDAWSDLWQSADSAVGPMTTVELEAAVPQFGTEATDVEDIPSPALTSFEVGVLSGLADLGAVEDARALSQVLASGAGAEVVGRSWSGRARAGDYREVGGEFVVPGAWLPVGVGLAYTALPSGLSELARLVVTSGELPEWLEYYADTGASSETEYVALSVGMDWLTGYRAMSEEDKAQAYHRLPQGPGLIGFDPWGWGGGNVAPLQLGSAAAFAQGMRLGKGEVLEIERSDSSMARALAWDGYLLGQWQVASGFDGPLGYAWIEINVIEIMTLGATPSGVLDGDEPVYDGDLASVGYLMGAEMRIPVIQGTERVWRYWRGFHVTPDIREVALWHDFLVAWLLPRLVPGSDFPDVEYVAGGGAALSLPWDAVGAPEFGTAVQDGTGSDVWWVVNPVAALEAAFVPTVGVAARVTGLASELETRWPFSLASSLAFTGSVGAGPISVASIDLGRVEVQPDNAWLNQLGQVTRLAASALLATLLFVWIRGKVMPKAVV